MHTQNVSAHNYILELNKCTTCEKWQKLNKLMWVYVLFPSISFSLPIGGCWNRVGAGRGSYIRGGLCHYSETKWFASNRCWTLIHTSEVTKLEQLKEGGRAGWGGGHYCYIIQCRFMSNTTNTPSIWFMKKKKEKEWEFNSMNRGKKMNITQLCWVLLCFCEDSALVYIFVRTC